MLTFTVSQGGNENSRAKTVLHVEGNVASSDWVKLRELGLDALKNSDHLVLNLEKVINYDHYFSILVCLLRKTAQLLGKQLTVVGKQEETLPCVYEAALGSNRGCSFTETSACCEWDNLFTKTAVL